MIYLHVKGNFENELDEYKSKSWIPGRGYKPLLMWNIYWMNNRTHMKNGSELSLKLNQYKKNSIVISSGIPEAESALYLYAYI